MKYAFLLLALMFVGCKNGYEKGGETIVANGKVIEVAIEDLPEVMTWNDAFKACKELENGWRLPNIEELEEVGFQLHLYDDSRQKGGFKKDSIGYWSSSKDEVSAKSYRFDSLDTENDGFYFESKRNVRAVRTLP